MLKKQLKRKQRQKRVSKKIIGYTEKPRLSVFRSANHIYAQIIDSNTGKTVVSANDKNIKKGKKTEKAFKAGEIIAKEAMSKKIKEVVFDRAGYKYHGRVKSLAEGARKEGLKF
ncbi:MAG: 50S ribosomal protein L18 [Candidatus Pacebacteria bacterium]|jgi:large subunit ribosomal protein L18|nr:50S ribosomal protein L18 [Candidatus Paceibacterota bacterium]MDD3072138.1 50S ribosomal protein L18 [Candidatus Paceibacterota bacterium]MDD3728797.1 50S ribosomal protein L18 [Candidatus Paceibacterota bacterium]MDD4201344.1 50S ribosomal protein L18 [Candidatus Paceibacterota bacterium]MDD4466901.1 50S ribosomal protein L18 [Candidatus Paceibacterota bacterium]